MKRLLVGMMMLGLASCGAKVTSEDGAAAPVNPPDLPKLTLDAQVNLSGKTAVNPAATAPFTHSLIQMYEYETGADTTFVFQQQNGAHLCQSGSHFEGPLVSITKPDGSIAIGEALKIYGGVLDQFKLAAAKGKNVIKVQFNADAECSVELGFKIQAFRSELNLAPSEIDKNLVGVWNKSATNHSHRIVARLNIAEGGLWSSKVSLNDAVVYDIDFMARTNASVVPGQLELTVKEVRLGSKEHTERVGDVFRCIYQTALIDLRYSLKMHCLGKGHAFFPTAFPADDTEIYQSGDLASTAQVLFEQSNLNLAIPDGDSSGVVKYFEIADDGVIGELSVFVAVKHSYLSEVQITLIDPRGYSMMLTKQSLTATETTFGYNGRAVTELAQLRGMSAKGKWALKFADTRSADAGTVQTIRVANFK